MTEILTKITIKIHYLYWHRHTHPLLSKETILSQMTFSQQHDLISANFDICRHKKNGSKIGAIQKEGPKQLKQIHIYLEIIIPYKLDKEEPCSFTHN